MPAPLRIGLIFSPAHGHAGPMLRLGRELRRRGHALVVLQVPDFEGQVRDAELDYQPVAAAAFPSGTLTSFWAHATAALTGPIALHTAFVAQVRYDQALLHELPAAVVRAGADALVVDHSLTSAGSVAEAAGIPFVTVCPSLLLHEEAQVPPWFASWSYDGSVATLWRNAVARGLLSVSVAGVIAPYWQQLQLYRLRCGLAPLLRPEDAFSPLAQISQQVPTFEFPRQALPPHLHFTGPLLEPEPDTGPPLPEEDPIVFISLGTVHNGIPDLYRTLAAASAGISQPVIITTGGRPVHGLAPLPGDPIVSTWVPQRRLLRRAALTVTHGGLNTTLESLARGVPLVLVPIANDQVGVAARVRWTGTGEVVPLAELSVPRLRAAVLEVMGEPSYRLAAARLAEEIRQAGGVARAAEIVEEAVTTRRPVIASRRAAPAATEGASQ